LPMIMTCPEISCPVAHIPEKWTPVFREGYAPT
jgi:hypothetical protein